jgi:transcriptional regulator with XRE-family HTH domain
MFMPPSTTHVQPLSGPEKAFGQALKSIRTERGVSQERMSLEAECDRTTVSLIERGLVSAKLSTIVKMCRVLRINPSQLMLRMEKSPYYRR